MGYKFNDISETLGIHPVTAGRCAEKGKKLIDNYEGIWDILEKRSWVATSPITKEGRGSKGMLSFHHGPIPINAWAVWEKPIIPWTSRKKLAEKRNNETTSPYRRE